MDTSVLVAVFYGDHERHRASLNIFLRYGKQATGCGAHSLAEVYATLTAMPGKHRVSGDATLLFLQSVREHVQVLALNAADYWQVLEQAAPANLASGAIYDALLGACAMKFRAEALYTWNTGDFLRLPGGIASRVRRPE